MNKVILSIFFCTALVFSQSKKVFVPYFRAASNAKIDRATCGTLADMFAAKLKESSGWDVITEGDISSMLEQEERKKMVDCTEGSCMQEIAGAVGAPYLISGNIAVAGGTTIINISLVDIRNGVTVEKSTAMASTVDELLLKFDGMAEKIGGGNSTPKIATKPKTTVVSKSQPSNVSQPDPIIARNDTEQHNNTLKDNISFNRRGCTVLRNGRELSNDDLRIMYAVSPLARLQFKKGIRRRVTGNILFVYPIIFGIPPAIIFHISATRQKKKAFETYKAHLNSL